MSVDAYNYERRRIIGAYETGYHPTMWQSGFPLVQQL
jgi:hypothetical protein